MLRFVLALLASVVLLLPASAQEAQPANPEIEAVISGQLVAFTADDLATAFTFAAPNIQGIFRTPENFGVMVRRGYPMVWRPGRVQFLDLREIAGALWQRVEITDQAGRVHRLDYQMRQGGSGWKIGAVHLLQEPDVSV